MTPSNPQDPQQGKPHEDVQAGEDAKEAAELSGQPQSAEQPDPSATSGGTPSGEGAAAGETGIDKDAADALASAGDGADEEPLAAPGDDDPAAADDEVVAASDDEPVDEQQARADEEAARAATAADGATDAADEAGTETAVAAVA